MQLLPDMAENASVTVVFREILALQVQKVQSAGWCWSGKQHQFFMQDWLTERGLWAPSTTGSSVESWCVLTAPHSSMVGLRWSYHGCKELCKSSRCCFPTAAWFAHAQLQVPPLLHAPTCHPLRVCPQEGAQLLSLSSEEEEQVPSAPHCWWPWHLEPAHLHSASLLSHLANWSWHHSANQEQGLLPWGFCSARPKPSERPSLSFWSQALWEETRCLSRSSCTGVLALADP